MTRKKHENDSFGDTPYFTPLIFFDLEQPVKWKKIKNSRLKLKQITDAELSRYFGITERELGDDWLVFDYKSNENFSRVKRVFGHPWILSALLQSKYALVSEFQAGTP